MKKICLLLVVVLSIVLFAGCKIDPDATYTVTYMGNDETSGFAPSDNNQYKSGEEATILGQGTLLRTGYNFLNWNTKSDGTGEPYSPGDTITINGAVFLYAIWVVKP
jgi:hypothetical protein